AGRRGLAGPRWRARDEPVAAIDRARRQEVLPYLERLRDRFRIPIVYVSHQFEEVLQLATHVVLIDGGRVAAQGDVANVSRDPALRALIGADAAGGGGGGGGGAVVGGEVWEVPRGAALPAASTSGGACACRCARARWCSRPKRRAESRSRTCSRGGSRRAHPRAPAAISSKSTSGARGSSRACHRRALRSSISQRGDACGSSSAPRACAVPSRAITPSRARGASWPCAAPPGACACGPAGRSPRIPPTPAA